MIYLKQSTASQEVPLGFFVDSSDGNTEETGLTIANTDIKVWKCGATTLANKNSGGATHISNGIYYAVLDATDTDTLGSLVIFVHVSGALAIKVDCCVLAANVYDALIGGGDLLQVDVQQFGNTNATTSGGRPEVNTTHAAGTAWGSGAITAASIATDAIDGDAIAASAVTEIQAGLSTLDAAGIRTAIGLASANMDTQLDALPTAAENADALLGRNVSGGSSTGRLVKEALHFLRNKWTVSGGTLTVYDTDDSTSSWTATVTGTAGADPVTASDPA